MLARRWLVPCVVGSFALCWAQTEPQPQTAYAVVQMGHAGGVGRVAFTPDGRQLITGGSRDGRVIVWDVATGFEVRTLLGHTGRIGSLTFTGIGNYLGTAAVDWSVKLWNLDTGTLEASMPPSERVTNIAFSPDGATYATFGGLNAFKGYGILVWNAETDKVIHQLTGHEDTVLAMAYSPDGRVLASQSADETIWLWDLTTGERFYYFRIEGTAVGDTSLRSSAERLVRSDPRRNEQSASTLAFSPDGSLLASASPLWWVDRYETGIHIWDLRTRKHVRALRGHAGMVKSLRFSADGKWLASASNDGTARIWNPSTGAKVQLLEGHKGPVEDLAFSPDGKLLATASRDNTVILWVTGEWKPIRTLSGHMRRDDGVSFASGGRLLTSSSETGTTTIWDWPQAKRLLNVPGSIQRRRRSVAVGPDGRLVASAGSELQVWDSTLGLELWSAALKHEDDAEQDLAFSPAGDFLALAGRDGVLLWDAQTGERRALADPPQEAAFVAFGNDGKTLAAAFERTVLLWNTATGERVSSLEVEGRDAILSLSASADGATLTAVALHRAARFRVDDGTLLSVLTTPDQPLEPIPPGQEVAHLGRPGEPGIEIHRDEGPSLFDAVVSPDGRSLAATDSSFNAVLWDVAGERAPVLLKGHAAGINAMAFSPDGALLATASTDKTAALWDVATGKQLAILAGHANRVVAVAFSPDGSRLATLEDFGGAKLWNVQTRQQLGTFIAVDEDDSIVLTPGCLYKASKGATHGMAFRVGDRVVPFSQFDLSQNLPEDVLTALGAAPPELIQLYRRVSMKRYTLKTGLRKRVGVVPSVLFPGEEPHFAVLSLPQVTIDRAALPLITRDKTLTFRIVARPVDRPLRRLDLSINGVPVAGSGGIAVEAQQDLERQLSVELGHGTNRISVSATDEAGRESLRQIFDVLYDGPVKEPQLYAVTIGVSRYANSDFNLTYAAKDAEDLAAALRGIRRPFRRVQVLPLVDEQATREGIPRAREFLAQSGVDDVAVVFLAGHGLLDAEGNYYFGTAEVDFASPAARGLPYEEIEKLLDGIPARCKLLLIDTCHAGEVDKSELKPRAATGSGPKVTERVVGGRGVVLPEGTEPRRFKDSIALVNELFADLREGSGAVVIGSASGLEFALESPQWQNGVFTYALRQGLKDQRADLNHDGAVTVTELRDYVTKTVLELTDGRQTPTTRRENLELDFTLESGPAKRAGP